MILLFLAFTLPAWKPHFSFLENPLANEMIALRWLHLVFGIIWIGPALFLQFGADAGDETGGAGGACEIYPALMSKAMGWFRWSALVTVLVGIRYFQLHLLPTRTCR